jgi:hypothetical protein
LSFK